jgi:hypothetical protein
MNFRELLLLVLVGWTLVGAIGITISWVRHERAKAIRHSMWIVGVWVAYLGILLWISLTRPQKVVALGQDQCFDQMCFAVTGVQELPGYLTHDGSYLVRVSVRISNHNQEKMQSDQRMQAYLIDKQGRDWDESTAVSGVPLSVRVAAGDSVMSNPIFKVARGATGLGLIFTHGRWQPGVLVIGDSDSLFHQRTVVWLGQ